MSNNQAATGSGVFGFLIREGTSVLFAGLIWYANWGGYHPPFDAPEQAFKQALGIGSIAVVDLGLQAFAVVSAPLARETRYLMDLLLSLLPLALIGYAVAQWSTGQLNPTLFQKGVLLMGRIACIVDVAVFTWFNIKLNKLASDFVQMR